MVELKDGAMAYRYAGTSDIYETAERECEEGGDCNLVLGMCGTYRARVAVNIIYEIKQREEA